MGLACTIPQGLKPVPFKRRRGLPSNRPIPRKNCLDIGGDWVSHAGMRCNWVSFAAGNDAQLNDRNQQNSRRDGMRLRGLRLLAGAMVACLLASGCMKPVAEHATVVAAAIAPVVDQASAAYTSANKIHDKIGRASCRERV